MQDEDGHLFPHYAAGINEAAMIHWDRRPCTKALASLILIEQQRAR
jgi:hypothetical protein